MRSLISASLISVNLCVPNFSTQKLANALPTIIADFILLKEKSLVLAKCATNPPAKVSPAPVGSNTSSKGKAGAKTLHSHGITMPRALLF